VFIGDDEAEILLGTDSPSALVDLIPRGPGQELVLKRGSAPATVITDDDEISVPALRPDVVDVTGAGDAFAAGYLAATCFDWSPAERLQLGHLLASRVVGSTDDVPPAFTDTDLRAMSPESVASQWIDSQGHGKGPMRTTESEQKR